MKTHLMQCVMIGCMCKQLTMIVHPDRSKGEKRNETRAMRTLVRADVIFENKMETQILVGDIGSEKGFTLSDTSMLMVQESSETR